MAFELPKLNFDDFYKFLTSFSLIIFILSFSALNYLISKILTIEKVPAYLKIGIGAYIIITIVSAGVFVYAMLQWKKNQNVIDDKLRDEAYMAKVEYESKLIDLSKKLPPTLKESLGLTSAIERLDQNRKIEEARQKVEKKKKIISFLLEI